MGMSTETSNCTVCGKSLGEDGRCRHCEDGGHVWTIQDWRPLLTLSLVIVLGLSFTRLVVSQYNEKRQELAAEYYAAGIHAMDAQQPAAAVDALESALIYSHDNFQYQLKLTDALLASGATSEAVAQLHSFLDQRPGDAQVNLKLARLEARRHHVDGALRYYLAAIEGDWPEHTDPFPQRIAVRFESAEYLVEQGRREEAEGALQALAAVLPVAWPEQGTLGDLFLRNGDAGRALKVYQAELEVDQDNEAAMLGAAKASMAVSYTGARRYLRAVKPPTEESRRLLAQLDRMDGLDPFAPNATGNDRTKRTVAAFRIATERLARCGAAAGASLKSESSGAATGNAALPAAGAWGAAEKNGNANAKAQDHWSGLRKWAGQLAPMMNERKLRGRDDVIESTMRFAFQAEMAAEKECGKATPDDEALLLLARERMGAGR
jgi:tetratricopeptide (TPR) repeat protein